MAMALLSVVAVHAKKDVEIRRNQVGSYPQQEKYVVIEGLNPAG